MSLQPLLTPHEVASLLGVPEPWLFEAAKRREVPCFHPSKNFVRFTADHVSDIRTVSVPVIEVGRRRSWHFEQVYFIADAANRAVKIGRARDVLARMRDLQCANPHPLELLAVHRGRPGLERRLHRKHAADRIRPNGEWFYATVAVLREAAACSAHPTMAYMSRSERDSRRRQTQ